MRGDAAAVLRCGVAGDGAAVDGHGFDVFHIDAATFVEGEVVGDEAIILNGEAAEAFLLAGDKDATAIVVGLIAGDGAVVDNDVAERIPNAAAIATGGVEGNDGQGI